MLKHVQDYGLASPNAPPCRCNFVLSTPQYVSLGPIQPTNLLAVLLHAAGCKALESAAPNTVTCYVGSTTRPGKCLKGRPYTFPIIVTPLVAETVTETVTVTVTGNNGTTPNSNTITPGLKIKVCVHAHVPSIFPAWLMLFPDGARTHMWRTELVSHPCMLGTAAESGAMLSWWR
jgi:hypothetical protein